MLILNSASLPIRFSGFMVACVYLPDLSIGNSIRETIYEFKKKYMYEYCTVLFRPGSNPNRSYLSEYPATIRLVQLHQDVPENYINMIRYSLIDEQEAFDYSHRMDVELKKICGLSTVKHSSAYIKKNASSNSRQRHIIITVTSKKGNVYFTRENGFSTNNYIFKRSSIIPMRLTERQKVTLIMPQEGHRINEPESSTTFSPQHTEDIETLVAYKHPLIARFIHWFLSTILLVKPFLKEDGEENRNERGANRAQSQISKGVSPGSTSSSNVAISIDYPNDIPMQKLSENSSADLEVESDCEDNDKSNSKFVDLKQSESNDIITKYATSDDVIDDQPGPSSSSHNKPSHSNISADKSEANPLPNPKSKNQKAKVTFSKKHNLLSLPLQKQQEKYSQTNDQSLNIIDDPVLTPETLNNPFPLQLSPPPRSHYLRRFRGKAKAKESFP